MAVSNGPKACAKVRSPQQERGERGFGYDAVFMPRDGEGQTFAEMSLTHKHAIGHRGRAFSRTV